MEVGKIVKVSGPLVMAENMSHASIQDICYVGHVGVIGEIIEMRGDIASIQVYEETSGIGPGEPVQSTGEALSVELAPGIVTQMFDGIQRPLDIFAKQTNSNFLSRGVKIDALDHRKKWLFEPKVAVGDLVTAGDVIGTVQETKLIEHKIMVPYGFSGTIKEIHEGEYTIDEVIGLLETEKEEVELTMLQKWPVRRARPVKEKHHPDIPMITGQRVIDTFFPVTKGGAAAVPGPFGAGKTVVQHQIAKWADVDLVVYVGCGERGNEMTDVMNEFPELIDPLTGESLMERTILIANTSNMPVAAREASIYTGITIAEYFRDMGYSVAIMADSTSRWAEALREMSGRLEEMPGDEGYPAYLGSRLAEYYERAGYVSVLGTENREGSITAISAVSPSGGDISEPVTQNTLRVVKVFWGLDAVLAQQRHFPSIDWLKSYSLYSSEVGNYLNQELQVEWSTLVREGMRILQKESELNEIVRLVGIDSLSEKDQFTLEIAKEIREDYLQQNAFDEVDTFTSREKQYHMLNNILLLHQEGIQGLELGAYLVELMKGTVKLRDKIARMKYVSEDELDKVIAIQQEIKETIRLILQEGGCKMIKEYKTIGEVVGPLMAVDHVEGVKYEELIEVRLQTGEIRQGQVLEIQEDKALIQIFEGTAGINLKDSSVRFLGHPLELGVSEDMVGRVFDGLGRPKDGGSAIFAEKNMDINGEVINPFSRDYPDEFIQTGISSIDHLNTLVRGQKLPVFSASGLPHKELAAQIARQASVLNKEDNFAVVFAGIGITFEEADYFMEDFRQTGAIDRSVIFMNLANDPAIERIATPRMALTAAEYLAYEKGMHVLVIMTDMTNYCEALREISAARREVPGRRGYPGYLYTNLATLYERAGRIKGLKGSVTQIPILTMPEEDKTHPIPDLTGYITEGQIILSRDLYKNGIEPPIDVLPSLSRLKDKGTGEGKTRHDHAATMNQLFSAYAQGKQAKELAVVLGEAALSDVDKIYAKFAERFEEEYVNQGYTTNRSIEETLDMGWELLDMLPRTELKRIKDELIDEFLPEKE